VALVLASLAAVILVGLGLGVGAFVLFFFVLLDLLDEILVLERLRVLGLWLRRLPAARGAGRLAGYPSPCVWRMRIR
jgi:hypothetical protein